MRLLASASAAPRLILKLRVDAIEEWLVFDEALHVSEHEIERAWRVLIFVI
jgi:hypothetical protein